MNAIKETLHTKMAAQQESGATCQPDSVESETAGQSLRTLLRPFTTPEVYAAKIIEIRECPINRYANCKHGELVLDVVVNGANCVVKADADWFKDWKPAVGGYYVAHIDGDGNSGFHAPQEEFERTYVAE